MARHPLTLQDIQANINLLSDVFRKQIPTIQKGIQELETQLELS